MLHEHRKINVPWCDWTSGRYYELFPMYLCNLCRSNLFHSFLFYSYYMGGCKVDAGLWSAVTPHVVTALTGSEARSYEACSDHGYKGF